MEKISFHYGKHIGAVARAVYFNSWKSILSIAAQAAFAAVCLILYLQNESMILLGISITLVLTIAMSIATRTLLLPRILAADTRYNKEFDYLFDTDGINFDPEKSQAIMKWGSFTQVWENKAYYLLFHGHSEYWFIAKQSFTDTTQENKFRAYAAAHRKISTGIIR
ncbi:YcxB family protein [Paenibacillus sp. MMS20-IR301]|uniref:YcxB family protein n=1 Tax=Paenibacillus sp. MMS20-IR301 TaxID=2895946 RepID=UPI0028EA73E2|nr:YcxB family protein [Paenibacillus sp. MMS20-IR301]WNS44690.1 YcxB family protein [Paenibacillus sp. MMS20-IR301]